MVASLTVGLVAGRDRQTYRMERTTSGSASRRRTSRHVIAVAPTRWHARGGEIGERELGANA
jgi:hypothetical protein